MYPAESLTGTGVIEGQAVRCISPKYMVEFLALGYINGQTSIYLPYLHCVRNLE